VLEAEPDQIFRTQLHLLLTLIVAIGSPPCAESIRHKRERAADDGAKTRREKTTSASSLSGTSSTSQNRLRWITVLVGGRLAPDDAGGSDVALPMVGAWSMTEHGTRLSVRLEATAASRGGRGSRWRDPKGGRSSKVALPARISELSCLSHFLQPSAP